MWISQIVLCCSQIVRCERVHAILEGADCLNAMKEFEQENFENLAKLAEIVRGDLSPLSRAILCSLITIDVHARDTITSLINQQIVDRLF